MRKTLAVFENEMSSRASKISKRIPDRLLHAAFLILFACVQVGVKPVHALWHAWAENEGTEHRLPIAHTNVQSDATLGQNPNVSALTLIKPSKINECHFLQTLQRQLRDVSFGLAQTSDGIEINSVSISKLSTPLRFANALWMDSSQARAPPTLN